MEDSVFDDFGDGDSDNFEPVPIVSLPIPLYETIRRVFAKILLQMH
jgi:hypothetical protein